MDLRSSTVALIVNGRIESSVHKYQGGSPLLVSPRPVGQPYEKENLRLNVD